MPMTTTPALLASNDDDLSHTESVSAWHTAKFLVFFPDRPVHNPRNIPSRYGEIKPPGSSWYGSLGTIRRSPLGGSSHPFDSSSGNGNNGNGYRHNTIDASNMSPFVRDVGQILLDNGSALRELSDAFLCLWTWPGDEDDDEGPSDHLATTWGLLLGNSGGLRVKGSLYPTGAVSKLLEAISVALGAPIVLSIYVFVSIVLSRTLSLCTVPYSSSRVYPAFALFTLVQALIACGGLLLSSLYVAQGVVDGIWSVGGWVAWV
ncbi:hypothetical protein EDD15DRAFT_2521307 [Pisolithus albus]|nr:hypothetical protein EDD15DRAFT_2521307 [Pisolithus albus]